MAPMVRVVPAALGVCGLLLLLSWTLITDAPRLTADFPTDSALIAHQADSLRQGYHPSHFVYSDVGIFYGVFAFYGGTLFAIAGAIALAVGSATAAQVIVYVLALAAAYGGWFWLARMAGLRSWYAHAPAILYVTAPYVLTNIDVRQDLTESVATAVIPLLLASALSVLRADRLRAAPVAALAGSTIVLGGTHNLTLLWATTILCLAAPALLAGVPQARGMVTRRGLLRVLAVVVPAMAVNAWYLLPDLAYHSHTLIAQRIDEWRASVRAVNPAIDAEHLFSIGRTSPFPGSDFSAALPVLAIAWILIAAIVVRKQWRQAWARTLAILSLISVVVLVVMTHPRLITVLPDPWLMIQYSYRLESFVLFGICGAVIAALMLLRHGSHRWLTALLLPILAFSVLGAVRQVRNVPLLSSDLQWSIDTLHSFSTGDFADVSVKPRLQRGRSPVMEVKRAKVHRDRLDATLPAKPREIIYLNLMAIAPMVHIQGAKVVGRWALPPPNRGWQPRWYLALRIDDDATPGSAHITIREARTLPMVGGWIISILGLLGLVANAAVIARAGRRRRLR